MKLADIQAESSGVMSLDERSHIRRILGVSESTQDTYYQQSEDTFTAISKRVIPDGISADQETTNIFRCRELRLLYKTYDNVGDGMLVIDGGREGVKISNDRDRLRIALQLWNRVFSQHMPRPNEDIFSKISEVELTTADTDNGTFRSIRVIYNDYEPDNEYSQ